MFNQLAFSLFNGLATGMAVFLVASGITLIFGILKILNFAQASFFTIGAYIAYTLIGDAPLSVMAFLGAALAAGLAIGALGFLTDLTVFRRLRDVGEVYTLIATFALLLFGDGLVKLIWGLEFHSVQAPPLLSASLQVGTMFLPVYSLFVIATGLIVYAVLELVLHRLWIGKIIQSLAHDRWMSSLLGINVFLLFTGTVIAAFFLAGLAGGLLLPNQSLSPTLSASYLLQAFVVVVIGGLGNIRGAFLASIILALVDSLNAMLMPTLPGLAIYVAMIAVLLFRPQGLLTKGVGGGYAAGLSLAGYRAIYRFSFGQKIAIAAVAAIAILSVPFWAGDGVTFIVGLILIDGLFALSWNLLFGYAGLAAFGHAAFFAIGAYIVALLLKSSLGIPFLAILVLASAAGALLALIISIAAVRRTAGHALAILTLAIAEITQLLIEQSSALGSDDGIAGIPRPVIDLFVVQVSLRSGIAYYFFLCAATAAVAVFLWWLTLSSFGRALVCIRQDPERSEFLGLKVDRYRLIAFTLSGAVAALAGGLQAPWAQIVTPDAAQYLHSTQPMLNTLLGGAEYFWGPVVGAFLFGALSYGTRSLAGLSDMVSGAVLLLVVMAIPTGILGIFARLSERFHPPEDGREQRAALDEREAAAP